jgi:hypothetical protein
MKTSQFIDGLAADPRPRGPSLRARFSLALGLGGLVSVGLFMAIAGPRSGFVASLQSMRFDLKFVDTIALALPAALLCFRLLRPDARIGGFGAALLAPVLLLGAKLIGTNSVHCLTIVPLLSTAPLAALLFVMRAGAPQNPRLAGAFAGLVAAGIAATLYASNCPDDSPLFVASWYPLATLIVVAIGAFAGDRLLRW